MSTLLAVDPGIRGCGVALFRNEVLETARYVPNPIEEGNGARAVLEMADAVGGMFPYVPDFLVCEWPQVYTLGQRGSDPNDLLPLAGIDGALFQLYGGGGDHPTASVRYVLPREWKGQLDPNACARRILGKLDAAERCFIVADILKFEARLAKTTSVKASSDLTHNIVDAIGIGLYALRRFDRKRVHDIANPKETP